MKIPTVIRTQSERFLALDASIRAQFVNTAQSRILESLRQGDAVYLDHCGLILPQRLTQYQSRQELPIVALERWEGITLTFEKCLELTKTQRDRPERILIGKDIFPAELSIAGWSGAELLAYLGATVARELVEVGISTWLAEIGILVALHNRQGETFLDSFGGAHVVLSQAARLVTARTREFEYDAPILHSAWEPLESFFEPAANGSYEINVCSVLPAFGLSCAQIPPSIPTTISVRGFIDTARRTTRYVTDGFRHLANAKGLVGAEYAVQFPADMLVTADSLAKLLTLAWVYVLGSKQSVLDDGALISMNTPVFDTQPHSDCLGLLVAQSKLIPGLQRAESGNFTYRDLFPVTADEITFGKQFGTPILADILTSKGLMNMSRPHRRSVFFRSCFSTEVSTQEVVQLTA